MPIKNVVVAMFFSLLCCISHASADDLLYTDWEYVLQTCVTDDGVDYAALEENNHHLLSFLNKLRSQKFSDIALLAKNDRLAFWVNAYNACALMYVYNSPYAKNLLDIQATPDEKMFIICGEPMSLNEIKHMYIRGLFHDVRCHFALAIPVRTFPSLRAEAYLGHRLNFLLQDDVLRFLRKHGGVSVDEGKKTIVLSPLFKWFGSDFVQEYGNDITVLRKFNLRERAVLKFLSEYMPDQASFILAGNYTLSYGPADWTIRWQQTTKEKNNI